MDMAFFVGRLKADVARIRNRTYPIFPKEANFLSTPNKQPIQQRTGYPRVQWDSFGHWKGKFQ